MIRGVIIPHDEDLALCQKSFGDLADYQKAVGGYIEEISINAPRLAMFANEEGKILGLPVNGRATILWWLHNPGARHRDVVRGDAVLIGPANARGESLSIPDALISLLFQTETYKVEVRASDDKNVWSTDNRTFDDYFKAATYGLRLTDRRDGTECIRLVAVN